MSRHPSSVPECASSSNSSRDGAAKDNVYVAGEFDDWEGTVKLECRGDIFTKKVWIIGGPDKDVSYKFIVDGVWKYCPAQPQITDNRHNINNVLRLERMRPPEVVAPNRTARPSAPKAITVETPVAAGQYEAKRPPGGIPALFWWPVIIVAFSASLVAVHWWTQKLGA